MSVPTTIHDEVVPGGDKQFILSKHLAIITSITALSLVISLTTVG